MVSAHIYIYIFPVVVCGDISLTNKVNPLGLLHFLGWWEETKRFALGLVMKKNEKKTLPCQTLISQSTFHA